MIHLLLLLILPLFHAQPLVEWLGPAEAKLGSIPFKQPHYIRFPFRNTSEEPLIIDNIRTGCGCTAPEWSEAAVAPGDTSSILIEYDAERLGYFRQWIRVYFHGQRQAERLWIEGEVVE